MSFEHTYSQTLPAAPAKVFAALTDPKQLEQWFATHAKVELKPGGAYQFWGKAVLGAPKEPESSQVITAVKPDAELAFGWQVQGAPSTVRYLLEPAEKAGETKLTVTHAVKGELPYRFAKHVVDDVWRLHLGNLAEHLRGRKGGVVLADFTTDAPEVRTSIEIAAPPSKVWRALQDPETMNKWLGGKARVDAKGEGYSYGWSYEYEGRKVDGGPTRVLEKVENEKLVIDWVDWRGNPDKPSTRVAWLLEALDGGTRTRVTLVHDGFELMADRSDYLQGWAGFLEGLAGVVVPS